MRNIRGRSVRLSTLSGVVVAGLLLASACSSSSSGGGASSGTSSGGTSPATSSTTSASSAASGDATQGTDDGTKLTLWTRAPLEKQAKLLVDAYNGSHKNQVALTIVPNDDYVAKVGAALLRTGKFDATTDTISGHYVRHGRHKVETGTFTLTRGASPSGAFLDPADVR